MTLQPAPSWLKLTALVAGLLGFLLFAATPFLPVKQVQSSVEWPQAGSLASINAPLISVAPESLDVDIPLSAREHLRPGQDLLFGTVPPSSKEATNRGLFVRATPDSLTVTSLDEVLLDLNSWQLDALDDAAVLHLSATGDGVEGGIGKHEFTSEDDLRPQVTGVYTELDDSPAARAALKDMHAQVEINSRFTSSPTALKLIAMWTGLAMVLVSLFALWRIDRLDGRRLNPLPETWKRPRALDGLVLAILGYWHIFGSNTSDDGFILTMARVSKHADYMANYYRWYGVPESPFGSPFYDLLAFLAQISTSSVFMRLPALISGILVWFILSREILPRFGEIVDSRRVARWTAAFMFLAFWLPYNNGTRPEPVVALGVMLTWASFERSIATRRLLPAAVGTIIATITLGAGPTGLFAVGVFLVSLPHLFSILAERAKVTGWAPLIAAFLTCGTAIVVAVFGDQTFAAVMESIRVRSEVGPALPWYSEYVRYTTLFQASVDGSLTRRFAMFTMLFCLALIAYAFIKDKRVVGAEPAITARLLAIVGLSAFFLMFTPTKWTHHFGIYAGVAGIIAALGAVVLSQIAMKSPRARTFALAAVTFLLAITLAGWNAWWYVSSFGIPWWDRTVQYKAVEANTIVLVIGLGILAVGIYQSFLHEYRARHAEDPEAFAAAERQRVTRWSGVMSAPIAVACIGVVAFSLLSFTKAYVDQAPAYSVGKGNLAALTGNTCAMANDVLIETNTNDSFLKPVNGTLGTSLDDPSATGFSPEGIPSSIEQDAVNTASVGAIAQGSAGGGASDAAASADDKAAEKSTEKDSSEAAAEGGTRSTKGINGATAHLPFNLDYTKVPVVGSYSENPVGKAELTTQWFELPERKDNAPLLVVSAAGRVYHHDVNGVEQEGQDVILEYGTLADGSVRNTGTVELSDAGATPKWRNLRVALDALPEGADVVRIKAEDKSLDPDDWVAFTPPRVPELEPINARFDGETPGLLDWSVALQFPCQRTFDHYAGVTEIPQFRILPDAAAQNSLTDFQSFSGGGAMSTAEAVNYSYEIPSYLGNDWARDWGSIQKYELRTNSAGEAPKLAEVNHDVITRSGLWKNSEMKVRPEGSQK